MSCYSMKGSLRSNTGHRCRFGFTACSEMSQKSLIPALTAVLFSMLTFCSLINTCHSLENPDTSADGGTVKIRQKLEEHLDPQLDPQLVSTKDFSEDLSARSPIKETQDLLKDVHSIEELYDGGIQAYEKHLWYACASKLERALTSYKLAKRTVSDCRLDCKKDQSQSKLYNLTSDVDNFQVFGSFLKLADCQRRCVDESLGKDFDPPSESVIDEFEKRMPYQYLQFCYYKLEKLQKAAAASYTYFLANPDDQDNVQNIVYYRDKAQVPEEDFVDMEILPYKEHYFRAMEAYGDEDWDTAISHLEQSLEEYYLEYKRCLDDYEGRLFPVMGNDFNTAVADWMVIILNKQLSCHEDLSKLYHEPVDHFLHDMYHYLQFAYFQVKNYGKSAEAIATYLLFNSSSQIMIDNKEIVKDQQGLTDDDFKPIKEAAEYLKDMDAMHKLMDSIHKSYRWPNKVKPAPQEEMFKPTDTLSKQLKDMDDWMSRYEQLGMHNIARSVDLNREERFVSDGILKSEQCDELISLTEDVKKEPHGSHIFNLKVAQQRLEEKLEEDYETSLRLFVRSAEMVRHYTRRYLNPDLPYSIKKSSIVCWSPLQDSEEKLKCYPQEDGSCIKSDDMSDELYSDLYTTVTYLHTADEDGDFLFLNEDKSTDNSFGVKCGRTVGFNTGDRHTLKIPKEDSKRCALVLKYSLDPHDDESDYQDLIELLHRIDELRVATAQQSPEVIMKKFYDAGVKIVKEAKDLKSKERFVADKVASEAQCNTLKNMVLKLGQNGDGYNGDKSPHTLNEMFSGLSMHQVSQNAALVGDGYAHLKTKPSEISPHTEHEMFRGVTVYRAGKLAFQDMIPLGALRDFLDLSESSRLLVEKYFNLTKPLYFDFTHLVCRTAVDDTNSDRKDLSHPVHADNCVLQPDGECTKDYPAFIQRDYSAILYLNNDFEGGEFFFAHSNKSEQVAVRPTCGRLVGFNAGHFHGVRAVKSGQRCALALWFTLNPNFKELAHVQARKALKGKEEQQRLKAEKARHEDL